MRYILILLLLASCATLRPARPSAALRTASPQRCSALATSAEVQHILAIVFSGGATAGSGIAPAFQNNIIAQDCILGGAAAFGVVGAVLAYTAGAASATYAQECP
jgi:hypothetical protein